MNLVMLWVRHADVQQTMQQQQAAEVQTSDRAAAPSQQLAAWETDSLVVGGAVVLQVGILDSCIAHDGRTPLQLLLTYVPPLPDGAGTLGLGLVQQLHQAH